MRDWYKNRIVLVLFHLIAWTVFFVFLIFPGPHFQNEDFSIVRPPFFTVENLAAYGFLIILFYTNAYYLIPRFLNRKKMTRYILLILVICAAAFFIGMPAIFSFFAVIFVFAVSTAYRFTMDKLRLESLQQLKQNERLKAELSFLRSQISPHFIFNILNSAVSLARLGSDQLEPTLIKLSNLLRYMLYNADDEKVPISQELEYLESYIDLQRLRFEEDVDIIFTHSGTFFGRSIEPMLLIPFVENAFKHGIDPIDNPAIFIDLKEENGILDFHVMNKFNPSITEAQDKNSGIGLTNVKKRLELLYDDKYSLDVNIASEWFDVKLNLILK